MNSFFTLRACPFCGHQPEEGNLYDSVHKLNREGTLWTAGCVDNEGGCNASVLGSSREHAIALWNTRAGEDRSTAQALNQIRAPRTVRTLSDVLATLPYGEHVETGLGPKLFVICQTCGNKRCPKATNVLFKCTNSNAIGQVGEFDAQSSGG